MTRTLIVFAKAPRMGSVKTRLARGIGDGPALGFYRRNLARTIALDGALPAVRTVIRAAPDGAERGRWFPGGLPARPQGRGDIGERMRRALDAEPGDAVLIGADIPGIEPADIRSAFAALRRNDAVLGPARDGGFWLIGLRRGFRPRHLFCDVRWSAPETLQDALSALPSRCRVATVRTLSDIDDADDYRRLMAHRGGTS